MSQTGETKLIDLLAAAKVLPSKFKRIANLIIRLSDANSAHTDLLAAYEMIITARDLRESADQGKRWADRCLAALSYSAIILYARATKTRSNHRGTLDLRSRLSDSERVVHDEICDLRDDAVAHYGPGDSEAGPTWHTDGVFLPLDRPEDLRVTPISRRIVFDPIRLRRLTTQIHRGMLLAEQFVRARDAELADALNSANESSPELIEILRAHVVDAKTYFGSEEEARRILGGSRQGRLSALMFQDTHMSATSGSGSS